MKTANTVTRELVKSEIDRVQDFYLDILYQLIKLCEAPSNVKDGVGLSPDDAAADWHTFIQQTYGALSDDPIERPEQGSFEIREALA